MGLEDDAVLVPAVEAVPRARHSRSTGRFPADTVFVRAMRGDFDAVIACYHDQGLIPVKLVAFGHAVNVTLGCPSSARRSTTARPSTSPGRGDRRPASEPGRSTAASRAALRPQAAPAGEPPREATPA